MDDRLVLGLWKAMMIRTLSPKGADALSVYSSAEELYDERYSASMLLSSRDVDKLMSVDPEHARNIAAICENNGIRIYIRGEDDYPYRLENVSKPPEVIFSYGSAEMALNARTIAVVGARRSDEYAFSVTRRLSAGLSRAGLTIVSGFANGIDTASHYGALDAGGATVAVLGCGLLSDYPRNKQKLKELIAHKGAVITEYLPNEPALPNYFITRNRIIAGVSESVLCTQAAVRSGSLNTVSQTLEMNKPVFVTPPHDIFDDSYAGIISLLRDGAQEVYSAEDIIKEYNTM